MSNDETIWCKLIKLKSQDVINSLSLFYGAFLSMEVRQGIADWLEDTLLKLMHVPTTDPNYDRMTQEFQRDLVIEISKKTHQMSCEQMTPTRIRYLDSVRFYQSMISSELFTRFVEIFKREMKLLKDFKSGNYSSYVSGSRLIDDKIEDISKELRIFENTDMQQWRKNYENYQEEYLRSNSPETTQSNGYHSQCNLIELDLHQSSVNHFFETLGNLAPQIVEKLKNFAAKCDELVDNVIENFIKQWKINEQKFGHGGFNINGADLEKLQSWCGEIANILLSLQEKNEIIHEHRLALLFGTRSLELMLTTLHQTINNSLTKLIRGSVLIEVQPPQVIKTNTKFAASIRLLVGSSLGAKINKANVKAVIISESQARNISSDLKSGELLNNQAKLECKQQQFIANFRSLMIKQFKRVGRKSNNLVTDEKFGILFQISLEIEGREMKEFILSRPIVVIVHGSQEINALATIFWDTYFAQIDRKAFEVPDSVRWTELAQALSFEFESKIGRKLTNENLHFLAEKLFGYSLPEPIPQDTFITFSDFCKVHLLRHDFTFWEWFHAAFKLTKEHLKLAWMEGRIEGFISKNTAENLLLPYQHGTFMLRFSESVLGAITVAWVNRHNLENKPPHVLHIEPITSKDFEKMTFTKYVFQMEDLSNLYPDIPKYVAFRIEEVPSSSSDYIRCLTVIRIDVRN